MNKPLQIVQLEARNFTNLKAIRITPDKKMVVLTGANEAGKSNVLSLIQAILEGLKVKMPIREGEERAQASMDLGEIQIRKKWTSKGETLEVFTMVDGKKQTYSSPQTFLNELTGKMVDPMKMYLLMKDNPKQFRDTLAKLVGLDLTDLKAEEQSVRDERKLVNDKIRDAVAQLKEMEAPDPNTPLEEITFKEKLDEVNRLREKQRKCQQYKNEVDGLREAIETGKSQIERLKADLAEAEKEQQVMESSLENILKEEPEKVTPEQITAAEAEVEKLEETNAKIRQAVRYTRKVKESQKYQKDSDALTQKIERIQQDIQTRIANCAFPVEGLSLTDDAVLYDGRPLDVASSGRQIRVFTKMAMAMSPNVKVLLIRDGSFLDNKGFQEVCAIAEEEGFQIWMEKVDDSGSVGVYIENGEIKKVDGKEVVNEETNEETNSESSEVVGEQTEEAKA